MKKLLLNIIVCLFSLSLLSQSCLPEGIEFTTQEQVDNFQVDNPGCTVIEGSVRISSYSTDSITNLDSLHVITEIGGNLYLGPPETQNLQNLTGLNNLSYIHGDLRFDYSGVTNLNGLGSLNSIGGNLIFNREYNLQDISALANLSSIGGSLQIGAWGATSSGGTSLINLEGLEGLDSIYGSLGITFNRHLTDISALDELNYIGGHLGIVGNESLAVCQSEGLCNYLLNPNGTVTIYLNAPGCNSVVDLGAMCNDPIPCLPYGNYYLQTQSDIDNFQDVFSGCTELAGLLRIAPGLIGKGSSYSDRGTTISNLDGLSGVNSIGGQLVINRNDSLVSLSGIDNIDENSIAYLEIRYNNSLSTCEVQSICNYLAISGNTNIEHNAFGCNNQWQVEEACETVSIIENLSLESVSINPNPFSTSATLSYELKQPEKVTLTIYNHMGKQVYQTQENQQQGKQQLKWNAQNLSEGIYYYRLQVGDAVANGKMVKVR